MTRSRRFSPQTAAILLALRDAAPEQLIYGYDLCRTLEIKAGTVYPILMRLAERGLVETSWESPIPQGRPPRHLYRLTPDGIAAAVAIDAVDRAPSHPRVSPTWVEA